MSFTRVMLRSLQCGSLHQLWRSPVARFLSIDATSGNSNKNSASSESADEFERRIFGDFGGSNSKTDAFFQKLDRVNRPRAGSRLNGGERSEELEGLDDGLDTLEDGMDGKLQESAKYFEFDEIEAEENEDFSFRADVNAAPGSTYEIEDLNLRKPGVWRPTPRDEFEVTTQEVLAKADFRNVRFLANFITEAGIIIKRDKTKISAKAQRKIAREIKTARAFGLMPFTTMGTKSFVFGKTMENRDEDYEYETYGGGRSFVDEDLD